jgi:uncharacterized protein YneF (UPF0154 family)
MTMLEIILNAVFTGLGVTLGTFIANKTLINNLEKFIKNMKNKGNS